MLQHVKCTVFFHYLHYPDRIFKLLMLLTFAHAGNLHDNQVKCERVRQSVCTQERKKNTGPRSQIICTHKKEVTAATMWVTAQLNIWEQSKFHLPSDMFLHIDPPRGIFFFSVDHSRVNSTIWVRMKCFWMQPKQEEESAARQTEQLNHYYLKWQVLWWNLQRLCFRGGGVNLYSVSTVSSCASLPPSSNNPCCMASFSCLVWRLTNTNECKSMHASDQRLLLCGVLRGARKKLHLIEKKQH